MEENKPKSRLDNMGSKRNPNWVKGGPTPNPNGRPNGQRNYAVLYREALKTVGKLNGKEPDELELEIIANGLLAARKGDFRFYKDTLDRLHGTAVQHTDLTTDGKVLPTPIAVIQRN